MLAASAASAQPTIRTTNGVVNASSYTANIARGSWFVIFGTGMGPSSISVYSGDLPYKTELSGTKVSFTPAAGGTAIPALIWYTSAGQLAGLLPSTAAAGDYNVTVTYNNVASAATKVKVVERNFGFATQSQNGSGPAQATYGGADLNRFTTGTLGQWSTRPAKAGDTMVLWGTGLGADTASDSTGASSGDQTAAGQVKVIVGGTEVIPAYAGRSNGSPGLDQINFTVPANVTPGCFVSLQVRAGGTLSNLGSIAVAAAGNSACSHPTLSSAQLTKLDQGGTLTVGGLSLTKITSKMTVPNLGSIESTNETASGGFYKYTVDAVSTANFSLAQSGACYVFTRSGTSDQIAQGTGGSVELDAGAQLLLNGPNAANKALAQVAGSKLYSSTLYSSGYMGFGGTGTPTLTQGSYKITGNGGADVGAFSAMVDLPGNFTWSNEAAIGASVARSSPLTVTWTGGGNGSVNIAGTALNVSGGTTQNPTYSATLFSCIAPAPAGTFTVPVNVLQQLPAVSTDITSGNYGTLSLFAIPDFSQSQGTFTAPLTAGGNIDYGYLLYSIGTLKSVGWN